MPMTASRSTPPRHHATTHPAPLPRRMCSRRDDRSDLAVEGEPVCDGHGAFMTAESLEGVDLVGVHVTRNAYCTFGCFAGCTFTSTCWGEAPDGRACAQACSVPSLDERECIELVRECLGDDAAHACGDE